jgi:curli production assembly/transport component CsgF
MSRNYWTIAIVSVGMNIAAPAFASEMVYHPVSPAFGGNPLNGTFLLSTAQAQGEGVKSGPQGPDLSGLNNALGNIGSSPIIIGGTGGNNGSGSTSGSGVGSNITNGGFSSIPKSP